jgi:acetyl-CoA acyltransferase
MSKAGSVFDRALKIEDTTLGWRFVNPAVRAAYGVDSMPKTAENAAAELNLSREYQGAFALASQNKEAATQTSGRFTADIVSVAVPQRKGDPIVFDRHSLIANAKAQAHQLRRLRGTSSQSVEYCHASWGE